MTDGISVHHTVITWRYYLYHLVQLRERIISFKQKFGCNEKIIIQKQLFSKCDRSDVSSHIEPDSRRRQLVRFRTIINKRTTLN